MTVLVTGATGCLGQVLVARLLAEGRRVAILTRRPFRARTLFADRVAIHEWHPLSEPVPAEALEGVTGILHLMGEPLAGAPSHDRFQLVLASRTNASRKLAEAIAGRQIRLIAASLAIGPDGDGGDVDEDTAASREPTALERAVAAWEAEVLAAAVTGNSVANVRLGLMAGAGCPLAELVALARNGIALDLRGALIPAIDVADAAAMLSGLLAHPHLTGTILGIAPEPVKGEALARLLAAASPLPAPLRLPKALLRHRLGSVMALVDNRRRMVPKRLIELGAEFAVPDPLPSLERAVATMIGPASPHKPLFQRLRSLLPVKTA